VARRTVKGTYRSRPPYDSSHRITSITDTIGRVTGYTYDSSGRLITVTDPDSLTLQYTYDSANRILTLRDRRNIVYLTNVYDTSGRVSQQTRADSTTYMFSYTVNGSGVITQTDVTDPAGVCIASHLMAPDTSSATRAHTASLRPRRPPLRAVRRRTS
jgi:YD repeat-containing protein